jgi:hypothetical protein
MKNTPDNTSKAPSTPSAAPSAPQTPNAPQGDKTSRILAAVALGAAVVAGGVAYSSSQKNSTETSVASPVSTGTKDKDTENTPTPAKADKKEPKGENAVKPATEDFDSWRLRENRESVTLKSHNKGNVIDLGVYPENQGLHTFRIKTGQELETQRMKGNGECDEICTDLTRGANKSAVHFEDPACEKPNTHYGTVAIDYSLKKANVSEITYTDLNGEDAIAPFNTTLHVLGQVVPGKNCTDLARGTDTERSTVRISSAPNLEPRVKKLEDTVAEHTAILTQDADRLDAHDSALIDLTNAFNQAANVCADPNAPLCREARKAVRHNATDTAKAEAKKDNPY